MGTDLRGTGRGRRGGISVRAQCPGAEGSPDGLGRRLVTWVSSRVACPASLLDSELDCTISGKSTVVAAVRECQSLVPPAAVLCQALRGIWECSSDPDRSRPVTAGCSLIVGDKRDASWGSP